MKLNLSLNKRRKGFTLIEVLLVVGFIAIASVGVYVIYNKVQTTNNANKEAKNLDLIRAGIKQLYSTQTSYAGLSNQVVNSARITPENMTTSNNNQIVNSFGGSVTITPVSLNNGTNNAFRITYERVPGEVCIKLASSVAAQFNQVTVGNTNIKPFGINEINIANMTTACNEDTGAGVRMIFDSL